MRETRLSGSEGGGAKPIASPYPYKSYRRYASKNLFRADLNLTFNRELQKGGDAL